MSNTQTAQLKTRVGRFLWGDLYKKVTEDYDGNPLPANKQYLEIGIAIEKQAGEQGWWTTPEGAIIFQVGSAGHPHSYQRPDFSWKVTDGDSAVPGKPKNGKPGRAPKDKVGFPGHWVFSFRTTLDVKVVNEDGSAYLLDQGAVRPGDYVQVFGDCAPNTGATPGVYLNPRFVSLQWKGQPIVSGPDPKSLGFGGLAKPAGFQAPTGAAAAPLGGLPAQGGFPVPGGLPAAGAGFPGAVGMPNAGVPAGLPGGPVGFPAAGAAQVPGGVPAGFPNASPAQTFPSNGVPAGFPAQPTAVQPHPGILNPPALQAAPAAPVVPTLHPTLVQQGHTWASLQAQGVTLEHAKAQGWIVG